MEKFAVGWTHEFWSCATCVWRSTSSTTPKIYESTLKLFPLQSFQCRSNKKTWISDSSVCLENLQTRLLFIILCIWWEGNNRDFLVVDDGAAAQCVNVSWHFIFLLDMTRNTSDLVRVGIVPFGIGWPSCPSPSPDLLRWHGQLLEGPGRFDGVVVNSTGDWRTWIGKFDDILVVGYGCDGMDNCRWKVWWCSRVGTGIWHGSEDLMA